MKLSEMRQLLASEGIQLTKSLGQNFLHDANQLRRIVRLAELTEADQVLEIGPGLGPLTGLLLAQAAKVVAIEKDRRLAALLQRRFAGAANFELIVADALDYARHNRTLPFRSGEQRQGGSMRSNRATMPSNVCRGLYKLVSNLPYSVASPIIVEFAQRSDRPALMVVTLQLEVVRRLLASPGGTDYGLLTVLIQAWYEPADWFKIPASCFFPEPDVDSATIKLNRRARPILTEEMAETFAALVKQGFSQRRKMMLKLLKQRWPEERLRAAFAASGLAEEARAESASPEQFAQLAKFLH